MARIVYATREPRGPGFERLAAAEVALVHDAERLAEAEGILCFPGDPVGAALLERAPRLRVVSTASVGYDHVDAAALRARGIPLGHTPDVLTAATAELAFALTLAACRRVVEADRYVRAGRWTGFAFDLLLGTELAGSTLGVVGAGRIGRAVIERALAFEMRIVYASLTPKPDLDARGAQRLPLDEVLAESDVVSLHVPLNAATRHLLGARELARMKPGAVLVNTARGPVIDEAALALALRRGRPAAAGLDVFEREPELTDGLTDLPNVVLLPHLGSATERTRRRMAELAVANLLAGLDGRPLPRAAVGGAGDPGASRGAEPSS